MPSQPSTKKSILPAIASTESACQYYPDALGAAGVGADEVA